MATVVGICNSALVKVGAATITALSDDSKEARTCNEQYAKVRDAVLEAHPWRFAIKRVSLALLPTPPAFGYTNAFQLPADCLGVLHADDETIKYEVEGDQLLTDASAIKIRYIAQIVDSSKYLPLFAEAVACRLAVELAYAISSNATLAASMMSAYQGQLREARSINGQRSGSPKQVPRGSWVESRY
jgi:hypothetical protein